MELDNDCLHTKYNENVEEIILKRENIKKIAANSFYGFKFLKRINLSHNEIKWIGQSRFFIPRFSPVIEEIDLSFNEISELEADSTFDGIRETLKKLNLSNNQINLIDTNAFKLLHNLIFLDISYNSIESIDLYAFDGQLNANAIEPDYNNNNISGLTSLKELILNHNSIKYITKNSFSSLSNLKKLDLRGNKLEEINPDTFKHLENLEILDLSGNQITGIEAKSFCGLFSLKMLFLQQNKIKLIHKDAFKELKNLNKLYLHKNQMKNMFNGIPSLKLLNLNQNQIEEVTNDKFKDFENLEILFLNRNNFKIIEENAFSNLKCLDVLSLQENHSFIGEFPNHTLLKIKDAFFHEIANLKQLNLKSSTLLPSLDSSFIKLKYLDTLNLMDTNLKRINFNDFKDLKNLKKLYLTSSEIEFIEDDSFKHLGKLEILCLENNKITEIKEKTFHGLKCLKWLFLGKNKIELIQDQAFDDLENLEILYLNGILIENLNSRVFKKLNYLKKLIVFDDVIINMPNFSDDKLIINKSNISEALKREYFNYEITSRFVLSNKSLSSISVKDKWKCLQTNFRWQNIPSKFCALIGRNGIGKTSVLTLIYESLIEARFPEFSKYFIIKYFNSAEDKISNDSIELEDLNKKISIFFKESPEVNEFFEFLYNNINQFSLKQYLDFILIMEREIGGSLEVHSNRKIEIFNTYFLKHSGYQFSSKRLDERRKEQIDFINGYECDEKGRIHWDLDRKKYYSKLKPIEYYLENELNINLEKNHKLSTGENLLILILLWQCHAQFEHFRIKIFSCLIPIQKKLKILLLDEPDSYMYPMLIKSFIDMHLNDTLDALNLQIILTTHSPVTVSLVPIDNIFEIKRNESNHVIIEKIEQKSQLLRTVSNNLFFIKEKFKIVFIEGSIGDDEAFYSCILSILDLQTKYPIKFQGMGDRDFNQIFKKKVDNQNDDHNIDELLFGINDGDYGISEAYEHFEVNFKDTMADFNKNYRKLNRYNIENYIYDPINFIFAILNKKGKTQTDHFKEIAAHILKTKSKDTNKVVTNIKDFIEFNKDSTEILNKFLLEINEYYLNMLKIKNKDSKNSFLGKYKLTNFDDGKMRKKIVIHFFNGKLQLEYYPIILYYNGKDLKKILNLNNNDEIGKKELIETFKTSGFLTDSYLEDLFKYINQ